VFRLINVVSVPSNVRLVSIAGVVRECREWLYVPAVGSGAVAASVLT